MKDIEIETKENGLEIRDTIDGGRFQIYTTQLKWTPAAETAFSYPVDTAVVADGVDHLQLAKPLGVYIRNQENGDLVGEYQPTTVEESYPYGDYLLELYSAPMKLYVAIEGTQVDIQQNDGTVLTFAEPATVHIGARSFHERPTGTITVTDEITDTMQAVSLLGSALKTTSSERSFPTLRGHPPLIEQGDEFNAPDTLDRPDTNVSLVLPPEREYVYPAVSVAYYHGTEVVAGREPRLIAGDFEYSLDRDQGYETTVNRVLQQSLSLDCLTRTEGRYQVDLQKRQQVESTFDLDFTALYDMPLADRLALYLEIPFNELQPFLPDWHLTTTIASRAKHVDMIPYLADDLSLIQTPADPVSVEPVPDSISDFLRCDGGSLRSPSSTRIGDPTDEQNIVHPGSVDTIEHAWIGEGYPLKANKTWATARHRGLKRSLKESSIEVHVVCNDIAMQDEDVVGEFYGLRDLLEYNVTVHYDLSREELADILQRDADFLHYIGHVDKDGMLCSDGALDAHSLDQIGVTAFLLNACRSCQQGVELIKRGSLGGVVTLTGISNPAAVRIGQYLARLLNSGWSLRLATALARRLSPTGYRYVTVGNGGISLCQCEGGHPTWLRVLEVPENSGDEYRVELRIQTSSQYGIGSLCKPFIDKIDSQFLATSRNEFTLSKKELEEFLALEPMPVEVESEFETQLYWSDDISVDDL